MRPWHGALAVLLAGGWIGAAGCGGGAPQTPATPATPTAPPPPAAPTITAVQVGTAGNAAAVVAPGATLQLWATATSSDGTSSDITNIALWRSSSPDRATISSGGLLTAAVEGAIDVSATHQNVTGSLRLDVRRRGCEVSLTPAQLVFSAFGGGTTVTVRATSSDCRWTVRSDAPWLPLNYDPNRSGDGQFAYAVPPNSTPEPRSANVLVAVVNGPTAVQTVTQERPRSCSYVPSPDRATVGADGGTRSFEVIATPGDCQWRARSTEEYLGVRVTSGASGTGRAVVTYVVDRHSRSYDATATIEIAGLSGANPPGRHAIQLPRR